MVAGIVCCEFRGIKMRESIDLVDRTKRDFLRLSLALPTLVLPYEVDAQESRRNKFRRSTPYNIKSISVTAIPKSKKDSELTAQERLELENGIAQKYPFSSSNLSWAVNSLSF